ncbi:MAG: UDP-N-acetylmuramate dehydrogenase [Eubacteriales bacterium]|nr:UDP-N-acetylmuramate dehydrogenase [Eubacteriales bacterium]
MIKNGKIFKNEPMSKHTSMRVGGNAAYYIIPANVSELAGIIKYLYNNKLDYYVIGNGTNLIVSDKGYDGVIIDLGRHDDTSFTQLGIDDSSDPVIFDAGAGCLMAAIGKYAKQFGGSGFEALSGIPGCIGGAAVMNAGAYGTEIKDVITSVDIVTSKGELKHLNREEIEYGYRTSSLMKNGDIVARVELKLKKDDPEKIGERMDDYLSRRKEKQPLEYPSSGSTFKRPEGDFAGRLIEASGLSGVSVGGAQVSEKHCGFVINKQSATAKDVYELIAMIQNVVFEKQGVKLEPEVKMLGDFS